MERIILSSHPYPHLDGGLDIFTYERANPPINLNLIPLFLVGRPAWDTWIAGWASSLCDVVSTNFSPPAFHLNHESRHASYQEDGAVYNLNLADRSNGFWTSSRHVKWIARKGLLVKNDAYFWQTKRMKRFSFRHQSRGFDIDSGDLVM
jgi:hypothetical protein